MPHGALTNRAVSCAVHLADLLHGRHDFRLGWEIRPLDVLTQLLQRRPTILQQTDGGADHFSEIVRRDIGRHSYRNAGTSVEQHIGQPCGQQPGLAQRSIKVKTPVHGALTQFRQQHLSKARQPGFGIAHRRK